MSEKPQFAEGEAPGHIVRRVGNKWEIRWQCRTDIAKLGFLADDKGKKKTSLQLWIGDCELTQIDRNYINNRCRRLQDEMLAFGRGGIPEVGEFDGTVKALALAYKTDKESDYHHLRYRSKKNHDATINRIIKRHGDIEIGAISARIIKGWHRGWTHGKDFSDFDNPPIASGKHIPMGHAFVTQFRTLLSFGAAILEDPDCMKVREILRNIKFPQGKARDHSLNADQVVAIRAKAHEMGMSSMALAQALQFECTMRQRDIIGEWVPLEEPGMSDVVNDDGDMKWMRGLRWEEVNENFVLRHVTSKRDKEVVIDLKLAPMVVDELGVLAKRSRREALTARDIFPASGPIVVAEYTRLPWSDDEFRRKWRKVATAAGVPKHIYNMDTRAGAITEGTEVASIEDVRHAAAHSQTSMTARYSRGSEQKIARVMEARAKNRTRTNDPENGS